MQGTAYAGKGQTKEALSAFRRSLKISPDYLPALEGAAQIDLSPAIQRLFQSLNTFFAFAPGRTSHAMLAILNISRESGLHSHTF
jgi:hypothetical protein